ncbi:hypothetical protein DV735_g4386, partial [Chaetothyriales sp. CBS 134920]
MALEKEGLGQVLPMASSEGNGPARKSRTLDRLRIVTVGLVAFFLAVVWLGSPRSWRLPGLCHRSKSHAQLAICPQVPALVPSHQTPALAELDEYIQSDKFLNISIARLSGAVQIPTQTFDYMGDVGEDERFEIFYEFAEYLDKTFPATHETLQLEKVNTHGLLYTWHGSDEKLKPSVFMAHQDVVPVPESTVDAWTHPPFSGYYDGEFIWGRGSWDCKNQLIGLLETVEELIKAGFKPRRTVILSFGFDEEVSGPRGAAHLAQHLLERYGKDGVGMIVDEGAGFLTAWGLQVAMPGVGEKGYTDVEIVVRMPGGHSSIPGDHTSIGVLSDLVARVENDKYAPSLDDANPYLGALKCGAAHSPSFPSKLKALLSHRLSSSSSTPSSDKDELALEAAKESLEVRYLMQTSVAVDIIGGGVKINALPERAAATVNHRINIGDTAATVYKKVTGHAEAVAAKYNLSLHAFDGVKETPNSISLFSAHPNLDLEAAPVTPTEITLSPYSILSGTTRALYGTDLIVSPGIMTGNTDTRHYWALSRHIFRWTPSWDGKSGASLPAGILHSVDERISVKTHINLIRWFAIFVQNIDESELD